MKPASPSESQENATVVSVEETIELTERKEHIEYTNKQAAIILIKFALPFLIRSGILFGNDVLTSKLISMYDESLLASYQDAMAAHGLMISFLYGAAFSYNPMVSSKKEAVDKWKANPDFTKPEEKALPEEIGFLYRQGVLFTAMLSIPLAVAMPFLAPLIYKLSNQPANVVRDDHNFFNFASFGYLFDTWYRLQVAHMAGTGVLKTSLYGEIADVTVNLALIGGLMFGLNMGLEAVALAYAISKVTTLIFHTGLMMSRIGKQQDYHLFAFDKKLFDKAMLKKIAHTCIPQGVEGCVSAFADLTVTFFSGNANQGKSALAGLNVASLLGSVLGLPAGAMVRSSMKHVGQYSENKKSRNAVTFGNMCILLNTGLSVVALMAALFLPQYIARILINPSQPSQQNDFNMAIPITEVAGVLMLLNIARFSVASGALGGLQYNLVPMIVAFVCDFLINIGAAAIARYLLQKSPPYIYGSEGIGFLGALGVIAATWVWKTKEFSSPAQSTANNPARLQLTPRSSANDEHRPLLSPKQATKMSVNGQ